MSDRSPPILSEQKWRTDNIILDWLVSLHGHITKLCWLAMDTYHKRGHALLMYHPGCSPGWSFWLNPLTQRGYKALSLTWIPKSRPNTTQQSPRDPNNDLVSGRPAGSNQCRPNSLTTSHSSLWPTYNTDSCWSCPTTLTIWCACSFYQCFWYQRPLPALSEAWLVP